MAPLSTAFIKKHQKSGAVSFDEINDALPPEVSEEELDRVWAVLAEKKIEVTNELGCMAWAPTPTPPPPAPATLRSTYGVRELANVLVEAGRWVDSTSPDARYHLTHAKAASQAFGLPERASRKPRRERTRADDLVELAHRTVASIVARRLSPFSTGFEGQGTAADLLAARFAGRFRDSEAATTEVLDGLLMAVLTELVARGKTITNEELLERGFDPWATPPWVDCPW